MKKHLVASFEDDYPYLTKEARFETGDGWYDILRDMFSDVHQAIVDGGYDKDVMTFTQIKEKFGTLNAYYTCKDRKLMIVVSPIIDKYEIMSHDTCERCGDRGTATTDGWIKVLCGRCKKQDRIRD